MSKFTLVLLMLKPAVIKRSYPTVQYSTLIGDWLLLEEVWTRRQSQGMLQDLRASLATSRLQDAVGEASDNRLFILSSIKGVRRSSLCGNQVCEAGERYSIQGPTGLPFSNTDSKTQILTKSSPLWGLIQSQVSCT